MVAVVGLGDHREPDTMRGTDRLRGRVDQLLLGNRQAQGRENLVGLFLVAGKLDGDVRSAASDRRLNALLVLAVPELHQRLIVQAQPGYAVLFGRTHQRGRRGAQCAALCEANELIARLGPVPVFRHGIGWTDGRGQERAQEPQSQLTGGDTLIALRVLVDNAVDPRRASAAGLSECDCFAGNILQLDGDVLEHVPQPSPFVLAHPAQEPTRHRVRAPVFGQPRQGGREGVDEFVAEPTGGPGLKRTKIEFQADDREVRIQRRPHEN